MDSGIKELDLCSVIETSWKTMDYSQIEDMLKHGANTNEVDRTGRTPLMLAVLQKDEKLVIILLKHGANPNAVDFLKRTPLMMAFNIRPSIRIMILLLKKGANPNMQDGEGDTALHMAVKIGDAKAVILLLKHRADSSIANKKKIMPVILSNLLSKNDKRQEKIMKMLSVYRK